MMKHALLGGVLGMLVLACRSSGGGDAAPAPAPIAPQYHCFELPGASRSALRVLPDGKRIAWTERRFEGENPVEDFVALDLASGQTQVLAKDVSQPELVGEGVVFLRATDKTGKWYEWKERVFVNGAPVSPEGEDVGNLLVDRAAGVVYFTTYPQTKGADGRSQAAPPVTWKVPATGGAPQKVRDGFSLSHLAEGGKTLVGIARAGETVQLVRVPAAGGEPNVLVPSGVLVSALLGDRLVFLRRVEQGKNPTLEVVPLAGGAPAPLPGMRPASRLLQGGEQVFVIDRSGDDPNRLISRSDGQKPLAPLAHLVGVDVSAAALLLDGVTLAAIVVHDSNADGDFDAADEADVCLVPTSAAPAPFSPPTRKLPKRVAAWWKQLEALASGDLAGAKVRFLTEEGRSAVAFEAEGAGPVTLEALFSRLRDVGTKVTAVTKEERLATVLTWKKNDRRAMLAWDETLGKVTGRAGAFSMLVLERSLYSLAADPKVIKKEDFAQDLPISTTCSGTLTNLGSAPIDVTVECRGWSYDKPRADDSASLTKKVSVAAIAAGASAKYSVEMGASRLGFSKTEQHFFVGGKESPWFNEYGWKEAVDYIATSDRVLAATGYIAEPETVVGGPFTLNAHHYDPNLVASGWNGLAPARQAELAKLVWNEYSGHYRRTHGSDTLYDVEFKDGSSSAQAVRNGKLEPRSP